MHSVFFEIASSLFLAPTKQKKKKTIYFFSDFPKRMTHEGELSLLMGSRQHSYLKKGRKNSDNFLTDKNIRRLSCFSQNAKINVLLSQTFICIPFFSAKCTQTKKLGFTEK